MKVLVLSNGKLEIKEIENTLEELQKIVGGYIEIPFLSKVFVDNIIDIIINEEGKYVEGLKPEIAIVNSKTKQVLDIIYGNCIFASHDIEGNTIALNDKQIEIVKEELNNEVVLYDKNTDKEVLVKVLFVWYF